MTARFLIEGVVQGVGFRYFVARQAAALSIAGWARNLTDGRVEVVAQGTAASIEALEQLLRRGPSRSRVTGVSRADVSDEVAQIKAFDIK